MTFYNDTRHATSGARAALSGLFGAVTGFFASVADSIRRYRKFSETHDELSRLSQRDLDDLGISRSMITRVAMEAAYKD